MKIGLEIHVALPTKSKIFCSCSTGNVAEPNISICPICLGFPGSKPMLNKAVVSNALSIAKALHCKINERISFVRKVYFYPDLPKSYQITQTEGAIGSKGFLQIEDKKIEIRRVQIEEDPAKIVREGVFTLLDFNRSGVPLVEIVTEPDIKSEKELWTFLRTLRSMLYYLGIDIENEIKADLNISVADTRVEVKNVTGIKNLIEASKYEIKRQEAIVAKNGKIIGETRGYNEKRRHTESMREKETDEEYGYIYEPDLTIYDIKDIDYKEPTYSIETAEQLANEYKVRDRTLKELIMFDSRALDRINKFKGKYEMQNIINALQRLKKYDKDSFDDEKFRQVLELIAKEIIVDKMVLEEVEKGKEVKVKTSKMDDKELDNIIMDFIKSNQTLIQDYAKNKKVINLIIGDIAKKHNLHPKDVAKRTISIINKLSKQ